MHSNDILRICIEPFSYWICHSNRIATTMPNTILYNSSTDFTLVLAHYDHRLEYVRLDYENALYHNNVHLKANHSFLSNRTSERKSYCRDCTLDNDHHTLNRDNDQHPIEKNKKNDSLNLVHIYICQKCESPITISEQKQSHNIF